MGLPDLQPGPTTKASFPYATTLPFDVWHRFLVTYDGRQATVWMPESTSYVMPYDTDIEAWWGKHATVETVDGSSKNTASIRSFNVTNEVDTRPIPTTLARKATAIAVVPGVPTSVTLTGSLQVVAYRSVVIPAAKPVTGLKKLMVIATLPVTRDAAAGWVQIRADVANNATSYSATDTILESAVAYNGTVTFIGVLDVSAFNALGSQTLNIRAVNSRRHLPRDGIRARAPQRHRRHGDDLTGPALPGFGDG